MKKTVEQIKITKAEKAVMEKWILQTYGSDQNLQANAISLILYKLHLLEKKIDKIEYQTKTHWAN